MATLAKSRNIADLLQTSQQKAFSTGLLTLVLVTALLWGSFRPTILTIIETNKKYNEKKALLDRMETQNTRITTLVSQQNELADEMQALDAYYPNDGDYSLFVTNVNELARKHGFWLTAVSFSSNYYRQVESDKNLQYEGLNPTTFQLSLVGNYVNIHQFLTYLENLPFLPEILSLSYSPNANDPTKTTISVTILVYKLNSAASP